MTSSNDDVQVILNITIIYRNLLKAFQLTDSQTIKKKETFTRHNKMYNKDYTHNLGALKRALIILVEDCAATLPQPAVKHCFHMD